MSEATGVFVLPIPEHDPLAGIHESERAIERFMQRTYLLIMTPWSWRRANTETREQLLKHLYVHAADAFSARQRFGLLREMLSQPYSEAQLTTYADESDFTNQIPIILQRYIAMYFDGERGTFSSDTFYENYKEAHRTTSP